MNPLNIFIGYDRREHPAYMVVKSSIEKRASKPVLITPLYLPHLSAYIPPPLIKDGKMFDIESDTYQATEFARSRFCIPFIHTQGWALFIDSDMVCLADINELFELADEKYAVMVVKHEYKVVEATKMDGQVQTAYPRKNWSSVILWNTSHPAHYRLTRDRLNRWPGRDLHAFNWLQDDEIGELPQAWNCLVGINNERGAKMLHYTNGTPDMCETPLANVWEAERLSVFC